MERPLSRFADPPLPKCIDHRPLNPYLRYLVRGLSARSAAPTVTASDGPEGVTYGILSPRYRSYARSAAGLPRRGRVERRRALLVAFGAPVRIAAPQGSGQPDGRPRLMENRGPRPKQNVDCGHKTDPAHAHETLNFAACAPSPPRLPTRSQVRRPFRHKMAVSSILGDR